RVRATDCCPSDMPNLIRSHTQPLPSRNLPHLIRISFCPIPFSHFVRFLSLILSDSFLSFYPIPFSHFIVFLCDSVSILRLCPLLRFDSQAFLYPYVLYHASISILTQPPSHVVGAN